MTTRPQNGTSTLQHLHMTPKTHRWNLRWKSTVTILGETHDDGEQKTQTTFPVDHHGGPHGGTNGGTWGPILPTDGGKIVIVFLDTHRNHHHHATGDPTEKPTENPTEKFSEPPITTQ